MSRALLAACARQPSQTGATATDVIAPNANFARKQNADVQLYAMVLFMRETLLR
ncbi:MAG: hypothetical protein ABIQ33_04615 [Caldimonas sp.]